MPTKAHPERSGDPTTTSRADLIRDAVDRLATLKDAADAPDHRSEGTDK